MSSTTLDQNAHHEEEHLHTEPTSFFWKYVISFDHKIIAKQFFWFGLFWAFIGAFMSVMIRWCLAQPGVPLPIVGKLLFPYSDGVIPPDYYNMLFTMHGTIMIFFAITPVLIGTMGNFCIPLMIGARDMIFPWLNMASFWAMMVSGVLMLYSIFVPQGASAVGWTSYPTLAHSQWSPGSGHTLWLLSLFFAGTSSLMGAVNYVTTVIRLRAPGMTWFKLPMTIWGLFLTAILNALFLPVLTAAFILLLLDRTMGTSFFLSGAVAQAGTQGDPILYQHLFWIFGHPEVYILILPVWGIVSDLLSFFSRKPAFGAKATVISMIAISVLSMVVYGHHMFTTGLSPLLTSAFVTLTLLISIPSGVFFLNWLGTMWKGSIRLVTPMWFSIGVVFTFGLGGLTGLHLGAVGTNILLHNTYFVVGHFHLTMAVASLLGTLGSIYFWFPKMFGKMLNETLGKIHFFFTAVPTVFIFCTMFIVGYDGMQRRIYNPYEYQFLKHLLGMNQFIGVWVAIAFVAQFIFVYNVIWTLKSGKTAEANPWDVGTLEWGIPSPAPFHNFETIPTVYTGPHEFNNPKFTKRDFIYQTEFVEGVSAKD